MNSLIYSRKIDYASKLRSFVYQKINSIFFANYTTTHLFNNSRIKVQDDALYLSIYLSWERQQKTIQAKSREKQQKNKEKEKKFEWNLLALLIYTLEKKKGTLRQSDR